jgi:hypothetical protein
MAGFRMHVSTSAVLGCGYAGVLYAGYGVPPETAVVSGAMCGFSGMLPDLDSDYGVPLREAMCFTAATIPMLLMGHFQSLQLSPDMIALIAVSIYLFVRFGVANMIRKYTVHRGMFHSIPAMLIFAGLAFLVSGTSPIDIRCYKSGGVMLGFMSHLVLDEIYAIEFKGGRWRFKKSFGTAIKFWGDDAWSNFSTYAKLAIVAMLILGQPAVMDQLETSRPQFAEQVNKIRDRIGGINSLINQQTSPNATQTATAQPITPPQQPPTQFGTMGSPPTEWQWPVAGQTRSFTSDPNQPATFQNEYNTAQRPAGSYSQ